MGRFESIFHESTFIISIAYLVWKSIKLLISIFVKTGNEELKLNALLMLSCVQSIAIEG